MSTKNYTPSVDSKLKDQLGSLLASDKLHPIATENKFKPIKVPRPLAKPEGEDGVDHINTFSGCNTQLGRLLCFSNAKPFTHSHFSTFKTIEGFWYYILSEERDDQLRTLSGKPLKEFVKQLKIRPNVLNFKAIIMDALYQKVKVDNNLINLIKNNTLPYESYYVYKDDVKIRPKQSWWMITGLKELSIAIKENREPDFKFLYSAPNSDLFDGVIKKSKKVRVDSTQSKTDKAVIAESESLPTGSYDLVGSIEDHLIHTGNGNVTVITDFGNLPDTLTVKEDNYEINKIVE